MSELFQFEKRSGQSKSLAWNFFHLVNDLKDGVEIENEELPTNFVKGHKLDKFACCNECGQMFKVGRAKGRVDIKKLVSTFWYRLNPDQTRDQTRKAFETGYPDQSNLLVRVPTPIKFPDGLRVRSRVEKPVRSNDFLAEPLFQKDGGTIEDVPREMRFFGVTHTLDAGGGNILIEEVLTYVIECTPFTGEVFWFSN